MMKSCVHVPSCNREVAKNTDKFAICPRLNFVTGITKIKTFVKQAKECPARDYEYYKIAKFPLSTAFLRRLKETKKNKKNEIRFKEGPERDYENYEYCAENRKIIKFFKTSKFSEKKDN